MEQISNPAIEMASKNQQLFQVNNKVKIKVGITGPLWGKPVDSPHKRPVMRKAFQCHDVFMLWPSDLPHRPGHDGYDSPQPSPTGQGQLVLLIRQIVYDCGPRSPGITQYNDHRRHRSVNPHQLGGKFFFFQLNIMAIINISAKSLFFLSGIWSALTHCGQVTFGTVDSVGNFHRSTGPRPKTLEEDRKFFLIFLQFYVYHLRFKAWGLKTFLTEFQTLTVDLGQHWLR